jgi:hypothetical protein
VHFIKYKQNTGNHKMKLKKTLETIIHGIKYIPLLTALTIGTELELKAQNNPKQTPSAAKQEN